MAESYRAEMMLYPSPYLEHHGVKGMHWGVRRYQNRDGSLTSAGLRRYSKKAARQEYKVHKMSVKKEKTKDFGKYQKLNKKIRKTNERHHRNESRVLTTGDRKDLNWGRYRVAKARLTTKAVAATAVTALGGAGAVAAATTVNPFLGVPVAVATGYLDSKILKNAPYYSGMVRETRGANNRKPK